MMRRHQLTDGPDRWAHSSQRGAPRRPRYRVSLRQLTEAQKPGAGVPAYLRWVNRSLGRRAAAAAHVVGLTPNGVTALSALFSLAGLALICVTPGTIWGAVASSAALLVGYALDSADGQLARLTRSGSRAGEWLDHVVDAVRLPLTHLAIAIGLFRRDVDLEIVGIALAFLVLSSTWFFAQTLADKLSPDATSAPGSSAPAWVSFVKLPYDTGFLYLLVLATPWLAVFVPLYAALFVGTAGVALLSMRRKYKSLRSVVA